MNNQPFKICPTCHHIWNTREEFLADKSVEIIGYQVHFIELKAGIFLFNHSCKGTFGIKVEVFSDMYQGPIFEQRQTGGPACTGKCYHKNDLTPCPAQCECAFVREVIQKIK